MNENVNQIAKSLQQLQENDYNIKKKKSKAHNGKSKLKICISMPFPFVLTSEYSTIKVYN